MRKQLKNLSSREVLVSGLAFGVLFLACVWIIQYVTSTIEPGENWLFLRPIDWKVYNDAAMHFLSGRNPYHIPGVYQFYNPPWVLLFVLPFMILPYPYSLALFMSVGFVAYLILYRRYNSSMPATVLYLLSAPIFWGLVGGQIDWIILLGVLLPPQYGLFLILAKPQVGCIIALLWLLDAYREKRVIRTFLPVIVAFGVSFLLYGLWPLNWIGLVDAEPIVWWPYSLCLGVPLLLWSLKQRNVRLALGASPMLSPHSMMHSWCGGMLAISRPLVMAIFSIGTWVYLLVFAVFA